MMPRSAVLRASVILCIVLVMAAAAYWPGLSGGFLFDDYANLIALGRYGGVYDWDSLLRYLTSGIADPTGRPVSMLSFLIDARTWPADPWAFKRTNLVIHLINGALLYSTLSALGSRLTALTPRGARWAALIGASFWLLHPLWVSTVLYVVQRQAMLAALFVLCGLRTWIASRRAFERQDVRAGWTLALVAIAGFGTLAGLSKANGFLLPLLVLVLELTVLNAAVLDGQPQAAVERQRVWARRLLSTLPSVGLLAGLCVLLIKGWTTSIEVRPWTLGQRLLSEPRVLFEYLQLLMVPGLRGHGLFADNVVASRDWIHPWTTLPAILGVLALMTVGYLTRRRHPVIAAALLFYFAGHVLESSVIPLELYFEHRNYLPAMLLFWPIGVGLVLVPRYRPLLSAGLVAVLLVATLLTASEARLWGQPDRLALTWASDQPGSARAQANAASVEIGAGRSDAAIKRLQPLVEVYPEEPQYALNLLDAYCMTGRVPDQAIDSALFAFSQRSIRLDVSYQWLARLMTPGSDAACAGLPKRSKQRFVDVATRFTGDDQEFASRAQRISALVALSDRQCPAALAAFNRRLAKQKRPEFALEQVGLLATHCGPDVGLAHLDYFLALPQPDALASTPALRARDVLMRNQQYWSTEWQRLRGVLVNDIESNDTHHSSSKRN